MTKLFREIYIVMMVISDASSSLTFIIVLYKVQNKTRSFIYQRRLSRAINRGEDVPCQKLSLACLVRQDDLQLPPPSMLTI